jgi:nicotinamide-nucleotide amidase
MKTSLNVLAERLGQKLKQGQLQLTTAESCTGGGLSYWITSVSGSSEWFERGFVTYSNQAKIELLGVKSDTIANFGAVSEQTACEMAEGALANSQATISVAVTGIAGPNGGTPEKPVGTVWLAFSAKHFPTCAQVVVFDGARNEIREKVIEKAFLTLLDLLV